MIDFRGRGAARAVADLSQGSILATVEIAAPRERVFLALTSPEITQWWGRPDVFDAQAWSGDVRVGGRWIASGAGPGNQPWTLEGEFLEVDPPRRLSHTWQTPGASEQPSVVTYVLEPIENGTRLTLRHVGVAPNDACIGACLGWEACLIGLANRLGPLNA
jgi:uncharacterized protein YndB with AHSA1/START domain